MKVGILALQGGFDLHAQRIKLLGAETTLIKHTKDLDEADALIIPGGESTTLLKLCEPEMKEALRQKISAGLPTLTTCAGTILIANSVLNPRQESLGLMDIEVERNAYGRQVDSFISEKLEMHGELEGQELEAVFIRAPRIKKAGKEIEILATYENEPVLVRKNNLIAATFHPELSPKAAVVHQLLLNAANR